MRNVRFTWDQAGQVTALAEPPDDILAYYLAEEVSNNPRLCRRLLDIIRALRGGKHSAWRADGQAWNLSLTKTRAVIESEVSVPGRSREVALEDFEELVQSWLQFLETTR
jgi:uncharacterized protein YacL (UPF0231 family)